MRRIDEDPNGSGGLHDQLLQSASQLRDRMVAARNNSLELAQALVDLQQVVGSNTSPVKALLTNWVSNLDVATAAYVKAATSTMINTLNPTLATASVLSPMADWWDCSHLTIAGVPAAVGTGSCLLAPSSIGRPALPAQIRAEIEGLKQEAIGQLSRHRCPDRSAASGSAGPDPCAPRGHDRRAPALLLHQARDERHQRADDDRRCRPAGQGRDAAHS